MPEQENFQNDDIRDVVEAVTDLGFTVIDGQPGFLSESGFIPLISDNITEVCTSFMSFFVFNSDNPGIVPPHEQRQIVFNAMTALKGASEKIKQQDVLIKQLLDQINTLQK